MNQTFQLSWNLRNINIPGRKFQKQEDDLVLNFPIEMELEEY